MLTKKQNIKDNKEWLEAFDKCTKIYTRYDIDKLTTGLHGGQMIIIAARPAMGKTAFALNLATNVVLALIL